MLEAIVVLVHQFLLKVDLLLLLMTILLLSELLLLWRGSRCEFGDELPRGIFLLLSLPR